MSVEERVEALMGLPEEEYERMTKETIEFLKKLRKDFVKHQLESPYYYNAIEMVDKDIQLLQDLLKKRDREKIRKVIEDIEKLQSLKAQMAVSELFFD